MKEIAAAGKSSAMKEQMELFGGVAVVRSLVALSSSATDVVEKVIAVLTEIEVAANATVVEVA